MARHMTVAQTTRPDELAAALFSHHVERGSMAPLALIAGLMLRLSFSDFMTMARDIHSDSQSVGKTPTDVANILASWATRQCEAGKE